MALTERERVMRSLGKEIEQVLYDDWSWRGGGFLKVERLHCGGVTALVHFLCTVQGMTVKFYTQTEYGIADEERVFTGDYLIEVITWVKEKALAVYDVVKARIAPYEREKRLYDVLYERALKGGAV